MSEASSKVTREYPCRSESYGKFCRTLGLAVSVCEAVEAQRDNRRSKIPPFPDEADLLPLFEARDVLVKEDFFRFRNKSGCMVPALRPGDLLRVEPATVEEISIGDIAVFRGGDFLYSHRVIDKREEGGAPALVTRPDSAPEGKEDPPVTEEELVGKVIAVERGKRLWLGLALWRLWEKARNFKSWVLAKLQSLHLYRRIGRRVGQRIGKEPDFYLALPTHFGVEARLFRKIPVDRLDSGLLNYAKWHLLLIRRGEKIGFLSLAKRPGGCPFEGWWISQFYVRARFRGLGLGTALLQKGESVMGQAGVQSVRISFWKGDERAYRFLSKVGFRLESQEPPRILMRKDL